MGGVHRHLPYDSNKAEKHAKFCYDNIERAAQHLNHEKMKADQQQEVRERHQRALEKVNGNETFSSAKFPLHWFTVSLKEMRSLCTNAFE